MAKKRDKALRDEAMFLGEARRQGEKRAYFNVVKKLLAKGNMSIAEIAEISGLNVDEISKISRDNRD